MEQVDRRTFIKQASTAVGVAGAAAVMPGLPKILSAGGSLVARRPVGDRDRELPRELPLPGPALRGVRRTGRQQPVDRLVLLR